MRLKKTEWSLFMASWEPEGTKQTSVECCLASSKDEGRSSRGPSSRHETPFCPGLAPTDMEDCASGDDVVVSGSSGRNAPPPAAEDRPPLSLVQLACLTSSFVGLSVVWNYGTCNSNLHLNAAHYCGRRNPVLHTLYPTIGSPTAARGSVLARRAARRNDRSTPCRCILR